MIDRRYVGEMMQRYPAYQVENTRIIKNDNVHMAHLAIIGSHSINGVAKLHSELLKKVVLNDFYQIYPERFNNKTNGITIRRWLHIANSELAQVIDSTIGTSWRQDSQGLQQLMDFVENDFVLTNLLEVKRTNKIRLAELIFQETGTIVNHEAIFDVHIKRFHGYKRQLLNLLHIVKLYLDLKNNPEKRIYPRVFIFAGKAAPSYTFAKMVIKCINEVARLINEDRSFDFSFPPVEGGPK